MGRNGPTGGNPLGSMEGLRNYPTPDRLREEHCPRECMYYKEQRHIAELMEAFFGSSGRWNYAKCYYFCPLRVGVSQSMSDDRRKNYNAYQAKYRKKQRLKNGNNSI